MNRALFRFEIEINYSPYVKIKVRQPGVRRRSEIYYLSSAVEVQVPGSRITGLFPKRYVPKTCRIKRARSGILHVVPAVHTGTRYECIAIDSESETKISQT